VRDIVLGQIESAKDRPDARPFVGPRGGRITAAVLRDATHWDEVVTALGYEHLRRHDLRHTGPTWMADAGVPVHVLRRITGHGSLKTTQRYLHSDSSKVSAAGESLTAYLQTPWVPNGSQLRSL
jgi:integrase